MGKEQKMTLEKIYNIMDKSGDGTLEIEEIRKGYSTIFDLRSINLIISKIDQ